LRNRIIIAGLYQVELDAAVADRLDMSSLVLDQSDAASIQNVAERLKKEYPTLNVIINNAGIQCPEDLRSGQIEDTDPQIFTNLLGPMRLNAALMPHFLKQPRAAIVNVSSALGFVPQVWTPTYSATKAAIHAYTMALRFQLRDTSVDVVEIIPPWVQTGLQGKYGYDSRAMLLDKFIGAAMSLLAGDPNIKEVVVNEARPFRHAERDGKYDELFENFNKLRMAEFRNPSR
jgi:uncharacterized oxidoreductase